MKSRNDKLIDRKMIMFMTKGMSLRKWHELGSITRELEIYNRLATIFRKIYIVSYGGKDELEFKSELTQNIEIIYKKERVIDFLYQFVIPFKLIWKLKGSYILKTNQVSAAIPAVITRILKRKTVLVVRGGYVASWVADLFRKKIYTRISIRAQEYFAYKMCDKAIITTEEGKNYLIGKYDFLNKKIEVVGNSIRDDIFRPLRTEKEFDIGNLGRLDKDKNLLNLLKAIAGKNLKVCFIGKGEEKNNLMNFAKSNNIDLTIIDSVPNYSLPEYYNKFKIFAFPSLHEGNPKALLEAMSCELPVVGCNVVGVANVIKNNVTGLLTMTDYESLKKEMHKLLNDEELRKYLGEQARRYIQENYSFEKMLKKEVDVYEKIT